MSVEDSVALAGGALLPIAEIAVPWTRGYVSQSTHKIVRNAYVGTHNGPLCFLFYFFSKVLVLVFSIQ